MASDIAAPPSNHMVPTDNVETPQQEPYEASTMNGEAHYANATSTPQIDSAIDPPLDAPTEPTDAAIDAKLNLLPPADAVPAGPAPVEDVAAGIQPVADFLPKDSTHISHPTPPPDEPLMTGATDVDVQMADRGVSEVQLPEVTEATSVEAVTAQPEQSLVRPREDDGDDEPSAKRTRLDDEGRSASPSGMAAAPSAEPTEAITASVMETVDEPIADGVDVPMTEPFQAAPTVEPTSEVPQAGVADSTALPTDHVETTASREEVNVEATQPEAQSVMQSTHAQGESLGSSTAAVTETQVDAKPSESAATESQPPASAEDQAAAPTASANAKYSTVPMTPVQQRYLIEKTKNLKKTKHSAFFLKPVDAQALNIPTYYDIIKQPMDLNTMDSKLKKGEYSSVQAFADDFDLIVNNSRRFNGDAHTVTQVAFNLAAYFGKMMEGVPPANMAAPVKPEKKRSPSVTQDKLPRRESRQVAQPAAPAAAAPEPFALQADGTPQIRRQSSMARPARAIKPPANREIPYAKPKRKAHQLELRFCEHVLQQITSPRYAHLNYPFLQPVDPVALNIPHYRQVIKTPMDLGTMHIKLKQGEYGTAKEFRGDFNQTMSNCLTFNPPGNAIRDMAIGLQREFESLWAEKEKWERKNRPTSNRASSASADDESAMDEDDDDEDEGDDDKNRTILQLQKQLADMQNVMSGLAGNKPSKKKSKSKAQPKGGVRDHKRKSGKPAAKSKKSRNVTYEEKQEISEAVERMSEQQVGELTHIITTNSARHREMGDEMELEIDDLPNDVQIMLLDFVRRIFGNPKKSKAARDYSPDDAAALDDDDFEPARRGSGVAGKRKKHKPMGKKEQQDAISTLRGKLAQFQGATSGSESPTNSSFAAAKEEPDTSGDEESEESEEE